VRPAFLTPTALADGYALGKPDAPVTVELWEDYQCPFCLRFTEQVEPQIVTSYVVPGKVRLVYRDFAFIGQESALAAVAARLAEQQDRFWPYHDYLFANQLGENIGSFVPERLARIATAIGLDRSTFDKGLQLDTARPTFEAIQNDGAADATRLDIQATPSIVVDGTVLASNDLATVTAAIDHALAAADRSAAPSGSAPSPSARPRAPRPSPSPR